MITFTIFLVVSITLAIAALFDGISTVRFLKLGETEKNPLFGPTPSTLRVYAEGAALIAVETALYLSAYKYFAPAFYVMTVVLIGQAVLHIYFSITN